MLLRSPSAPLDSRTIRELDNGALLCRLTTHLCRLCLWASPGGEPYFSKYNPYIIHYLTQTYVGTRVPFETSLKKTKLSQQNLIGIVCGSVAVFFIILGIIIFVRRKKYEEKSYYDDIESSSSSESSEVKEYQVNFDNETIMKIRDTDVDNLV